MSRPDAKPRSPSPTAPVVAAVDPGLRTPPERALTRDRRHEVDSEARMRIGEVAERLGLSLRSIRHYEDCGLVSPAARTSGGFRLYSEADVQRLLLIMQMKPLGFALDEMGQVLADLDAVGDTPDDRSEAARAALDRLRVVSQDVEQRWASLHQRLEIAAMFRDHLADELGAHSHP